jgi:hypothetical protein
LFEPAFVKTNVNSLGVPLPVLVAMGYLKVDVQPWAVVVSNLRSYLDFVEERRLDVSECLLRDIFPFSTAF